MKGSAIFWLILCAIAFFFLGYFFHKWITKDAAPYPLTYLERVIEEKNLSDTQIIKIREYLEEEDCMIRELLEGEKGAEINRRIGEIRRMIADKIDEVLKSRK